MKQLDIFIDLITGRGKIVKNRENRRESTEEVCMWSNEQGKTE